MTDLQDMSRVPKTSVRIEAYGTVDEANSVLGMARPTGYDDVDEWLAGAQNHLHVIQADLANPEPDEDAPVITPAHVEELEGWIDTAEAELDPLRHFILPGGSPVGSRLHHARAVCRRAERRTVALANEEEINAAVVTYLNRLSDGLFEWARLVNMREGVSEHQPSY